MDVRDVIPIGRKLDDALIDELQARLLKADIGVKTTDRLIAGIRADYKAGKMTRGEDVVEYLKRELKSMWPEGMTAVRPVGAGGGPLVILVTGINGAGKTTSIAKLCHLFRGQSRSVLLAACDTFRAGAVRQLEIWAERLNVEVVKGQQGGGPPLRWHSMPARQRSRGNRMSSSSTRRAALHTQDPLMRQLAKIRQVVSKQIPGAPHETLLVLDATTGQNALRQVEEFSKTLGEAGTPLAEGGSGGISGIFLAKLDGTAKGGIVIAIRAESNVPVKFVGLGERPEDVELFDPAAFIDAMFAA